MLTTLCLMVAAALAGDEPYKYTLSSLGTQGRDVPIHLYAPVGGGPRAAIIMMHGSGGLAPQGDWMREYAERFASEGYVVYLPNYRQVPPPGRFNKLQETVAPNFETSLKIFRDLLEFVAEQPNVDPDRIALLGYSMGAQLAMRLAVENPRVAAVALYSGGDPRLAGSRTDQMPPTIVLLGDADSSAPAKDAQTLYAKLQDAKVPAHLHIYPRMGHGWLPARLDDAGARVAMFFETHLGGPASVARRELLERRAKEKKAAEKKLAEAEKNGRPAGPLPGIEGLKAGERVPMLAGAESEVDLNDALATWLEEDGNSDREETREVLIEARIPAPPALTDAGTPRKGSRAPVPIAVDPAVREKAVKQLGDALVVLKDGANATSRRGDAFVVRVSRTELRQIVGLPIVGRVRLAPEPTGKQAKPTGARP